MKKKSASFSNFLKSKGKSTGAKTGAAKGPKFGSPEWRAKYGIKPKKKK